MAASATLRVPSTLIALTLQAAPTDMHFSRAVDDALNISASFCHGRLIADIAAH